ncbi:MAG: hypothetical protein JWQ35_536 [Bacteriovoracaceae bacterium]|nr:hypothetical protein [Bacteriovoracaceae bacterium]
MNRSITLSILAALSSSLIQANAQDTNNTVTSGTNAASNFEVHLTPLSDDIKEMLKRTSGGEVSKEKEAEIIKNTKALEEYAAENAKTGDEKNSKIVEESKRKLNLLDAVKAQQDVVDQSIKTVSTKGTAVTNANVAVTSAQAEVRQIVKPLENKGATVLVTTGKAQESVGFWAKRAAAKKAKKEKEEADYTLKYFDQPALEAAKKEVAEVEAEIKQLAQEESNSLLSQAITIRRLKKAGDKNDEAAALEAKLLAQLKNIPAGYLDATILKQINMTMIAAHMEIEKIDALSKQVGLQREQLIVLAQAKEKLEGYLVLSNAHVIRVSERTKIPYVRDPVTGICTLDENAVIAYAEEHEMNKKYAADAKNAFDSISASVGSTNSSPAAVSKEVAKVLQEERVRTAKLKEWKKNRLIAEQVQLRNMEKSLPGRIWWQDPKENEAYVNVYSKPTVVDESVVEVAKEKPAPTQTPEGVEALTGNTGARK